MFMRAYAPCSHLLRFAGGLTSLSALMIRNLSVKGKKLSAGAA